MSTNKDTKKEKEIVKLVIAGDYNEFRYYFPNPDKLTRYVQDASALVGYEHAEIVKVGNWHKNSDYFLDVIKEYEKIYAARRK